NENDLDALAAECLGQPAARGAEPSRDEWRKLPAQHEHSHTSPLAPATSSLHACAPQPSQHTRFPLRRRNLIRASEQTRSTPTHVRVLPADQHIRTMSFNPEAQSNRKPDAAQYPRLPRCKKVSRAGAPLRKAAPPPPWPR